MKYESEQQHMTVHMDRKIAKSKKRLTEKMKNVGRRKGIYSVGRGRDDVLMNESAAKKINALGK